MLKDARRGQQRAGKPCARHREAGQTGRESPGLVEKQEIFGPL